MTKQKYFLFIAAIGLSIYLYRGQDASNEVSTSPAKQTVNQASLENREVIDRHKQPLARLPASVTYLNKPSPQWKERLETNLKAQAGNSLKDLKIKKERSLVWVRDENPIMVESVVVSMTNNQDAESSFRAIVDSETGKVLESWDRSIFDPADVRSGFHFKLDERYSN